MESLKIGRKIEKGSFGKVYKGKLDDKKVAVKIMEKDFLKKHRVEPYYEIKLLKSLNNKYIVDLVEHFDDNIYVFHILEYVEKDLFKIIQTTKLTDNQCLKYTKDITKGLIYLNLNSIAHFDIKPENILVDKNDNIKIADFGHAIRFECGKVYNKIVGTIYYIAPEIIRQNYDYRADIWSLGICYYEMINKYPPFYMENDDVVYKCILEKDITYSYKFSEKSKENIEKMLERNVEKRIEFSDILKLTC